jgi:hypothetical protein
MTPNPTWHDNATGKRRLKPKTKRGLAFLIFALIALPVIRALTLAQPPAQSVETSKVTLAQAAKAPVPAPLSIGQKVVVVTMANWVSCKSFDDTRRLSGLIRSADMVAVSYFIAIKEPTGECRYLPKGTGAIVEDSNWYGYYCIRPEGDIDCLWADRPMLEDAAAAAAEDKKWAALSTELNEQFDRAQKSYAALEQSAFQIFNAQEMPISGPWPWQGVSDDCKDEREFEDCLTQANWRFVHRFNRTDIVLTHIRNCWAIRKPRADDVFGANCRLAITNPWRAPISRQPAVQP